MHKNKIFFVRSGNLLNKIIAMVMLILFDFENIAHALVKFVVSKMASGFGTVSTHNKQQITT